LEFSQWACHAEFTPSTSLRTGLSGGEILPLHFVQGFGSHAQNDKGEGVRMTERAQSDTSPGHCEADFVSRSNLGGGNKDCHASLAMTKEERVRMTRWLNKQSYVF
jgi:hypothetical protein